jgi:putative nucleotidyltransferase with HDIG domain
MSLFRSILLLAVLASAAPTAALAFLVAHRAGEVPPSAVTVLAASIVATVLLAALVARSVVRPLQACVRGALEIARGRFGHQVAVTGRNEIADLAYTFNHMSRELATYDAENRRLIAALEQGYLATIRSLVGAIDAKDPYTHGHAQRVADLAVEIGRELALPERDLRALSYGAILHDIGKIGVPDPLLGKPTPLSAEEIEIVRSHPFIGAEIVKGVEFLRDAVPAIRGHHERWDGGGYPDGLAGEAIPLTARIVNAADTWDACTSERPYQPAMPPRDVLEIVARLKGTQIDPAVHDALVRVLRRRGAVPRDWAA